MTFVDALAETTRRPSLIARPKGSALRPGLGWRLEQGRVRWVDPTALLDAWQWAAAQAPWPNEKDILGEWEVVYAK